MNVNPTLASLIMCLESVFAVLTGALLLGEKMTFREGIGSILMFCAVMLAQLSPLLGRRRLKNTPEPEEQTGSKPRRLKARK